jgi:hypothetical protein
MRALMLLALLAAPASAQRSERGAYDALRAVAGACEDRSLRPTGMHVWREDYEVRHLLEAMLRVDPAKCPGLREAGLARLRLMLGEPERGDVDLDLLEIARDAAVRGWGMAPDPVLAMRYGRILWLFAEQAPPPAGWSEAERRAFLARPDVIAMLRVRTGERGLATRRSRTLLGETLLRRDLPQYDPAAAATLLEAGEQPLRASQVLTDGVHLPADHVRAARLFLWLATTPAGVRDEERAELLRIGRLAAAAARTPQARGEALRILFAAGVHDFRVGLAERAALLRAIGRAPRRALAPGDERRIQRALYWHFAFDIPGIEVGGAPPGSPPARLRGLIGPDGRVVLVELVRPSRWPRADQAAIGNWARRAARIDLSATARGRFVWVDLPPVDPGLTTSDAQERWGPPIFYE